MAVRGEFRQLVLVVGPDQVPILDAVAPMPSMLMAVVVERVQEELVVLGHREVGPLCHGPSQYQRVARVGVHSMGTFSFHNYQENRSPKFWPMY